MVYLRNLYNYQSTPEVLENSRIIEIFIVNMQAADLPQLLFLGRYINVRYFFVFYISNHIHTTNSILRTKLYLDFIHRKVR